MVRVAVLFLITRTTVDRPALRRVKGNCRHRRAASAFGSNLDTMRLAGRMSNFDGCEPFVLSLFARLAAFWRIEETLVPIKYLLAGGPNEILVAVDTDYYLVSKLRVCSGFRNPCIPQLFTLANRHSRTLPESVIACFCKRDQV